MAEVAHGQGASFREHELVTSWRVDGGGVTVESARNTYRADQVIITAGAWANRLLEDLGLPLTVLRKVLWWIEVKDPTLFTPERFPGFAIAGNNSAIYGFPIFGRPGLKIAEHLGGKAVDPDTVDRNPRPGHEAEVIPAAQRAFRGVTGRALAAVVCLYTMTPDEDFVIDRHPAWPQVVFAASFSGHGFKFVPVIGEHLADLALDNSVTPFSPFASARFDLGATGAHPY